MNKRIKLSDVCVNDERIYVASEHTIFVSAFNVEPLNINGLLALRRNLVNEIKSRDGIEVKFNSGMKKQLLDYKQDYLSKVAQYRELYSSLVIRWKKKISEGIFSGYRDDDVLNSLIKSSHELRTFHHGGEVISIINDIKQGLYQVSKELRDFNPRISGNLVIYL
jgi:hypothetical protein